MAAGGRYDDLVKSMGGPAAPAIGWAMGVDRVAMLLAGKQSCMPSMMGLILLAGIVVNHNIVLIDTFHRLRDAGMEPIEAVIRSSAAAPFAGKP